MASEWLTLADVAERIGRTEKTVRKQVEQRKFPAPRRFQGSGGSEPLWPLAVVEDPKGNLPPEPSEEKRLTREMHLRVLLEEVRWWVWQHGSAAIPQAARGREDKMGREFPLGSRVSALRAARKHGRLSREEAAAFEALPEWSWDHWDSIWRVRFIGVAMRYQTGELTERDRAWLGHQRRRWGKLRPEWQAMFKAFPGLVEGAKQSRVEEFVAACEQWLAEHPDHTTYAMPYAATVMVDGEKVPVGRRAMYYRRRYRGVEGKGKHRLSAEDVAKIEALPGWTWEMSEQHAKAGRVARKSA